MLNYGYVIDFRALALRPPQARSMLTKNYSGHSIRQLVEAVNQRDGAAAVEFLERHLRELDSFLWYAHTDISMSKERRAIVIQATRIRLFKRVQGGKIDKFESDVPLYKYIRTALNWCALRLYKKSGISRVLAGSGYDGETVSDEERIDHDEPSHEEQCMASRTRFLQAREWYYQRGRNRLAHRYRSVGDLLMEDPGLTPPEIAETLGLGLHTTYSYMWEFKQVFKAFEG